VAGAFKVILHLPPPPYAFPSLLSARHKHPQHEMRLFAPGFALVC
jgi:hypothetical protein